MQLFYHSILTPESREIVFDPVESRHIVKVLRKKHGDEIFITDGKGGKYSGIIENPDIRRTSVRIVAYEKMPRPVPYKVHLAVAPTKSMERMEWLVEKAVELGVDEITPLLTRYSERKVLKLPRLEKIMISAMKQSLRFYLPELHEMTGFQEFLKDIHGSQSFIAVCNETPDAHFIRRIPENTDICILIGPEGGFSEEEVAFAVSQGVKTVSLGDSRLRTETAALTALHAIHLRQKI